MEFYIDIPAITVVCITVVLTTLIKQINFVRIRKDK